MIPHVIHSVWLQNDAPVQAVLDAVASWEQYAGNKFTIKLWTRRDVEQEWGAKMLATDLPMHILSDLVRVHILHEQGGVYLDADMFAGPGMGSQLAVICDSCDLFGTTFANGNLQVDTVPMGAKANLPGFVQLARQPQQFMVKWNTYLASYVGTPPMILSGDYWNAKVMTEGTLIEHRRGSLAPHEPVRPKNIQPVRPTLIIKGKEASRQYEEARQRAKVQQSVYLTRLDLITQLVPPNGKMVEVGTDRGDFAFEVIKELPSLDLTCVDPWETTVDDISDPHTNRDRNIDKEVTENKLRGKATIQQKKSLEFVTQVLDESLDCAYLDGDHYRPGFDNDLEAWWPKIKPGGILAGHDLTGEWEPWIRAAVEEFAFYHNTEVFCTQDFPASWFFVKP